MIHKRHQDIHLYFMVAARIVAVTAARTLSTGLWRGRRLLRRHRRLLEASRRSPVVRDIVTQLLLLLSNVFNSQLTLLIYSFWLIYSIATYN